MVSPTPYRNNGFIKVIAMKQSRSTVRNLPETGPEPDADTYMDETMAMVYVGDVYSLVAQEAVSSEPTVTPVPAKTQKHDEQGDDNDALLPFIR